MALTTTEQARLDFLQLIDDDLRDREEELTQPQLVEFLALLEKAKEPAATTRTDTEFTQPRTPPRDVITTGPSSLGPGPCLPVLRNRPRPSGLPLRPGAGMV